MTKWPELFQRKKKKYCPDTHNKLQEAHDISREKTKELTEEIDRTMTDFAKQRVKHS